MAFPSVSDIPYIDYFIIVYLISSVLVILISTTIICMMCDMLDKVERESAHNAFEHLNLQKRINTILERERTSLNDCLNSERLLKENVNNEKNKVIDEVKNYLAHIKDN
jgi:uncharacterized membrane protein YraQ (UPF0718 family)